MYSRLRIFIFFQLKTSQSQTPCCMAGYLTLMYSCLVEINRHRLVGIQNRNRCLDAKSVKEMNFYDCLNLVFSHDIVFVFMIMTSFIPIQAVNLYCRTIDQHGFGYGVSFILKLNYCKQVFFSSSNYLPDILLMKTLEIKETKTTQYSTFKLI